jgi:putative protein-disulfide isomerase
MRMATLYYFHDPMCSWCWGYRPVAEKLFAALPDGVTRVNVVGGLAADSDEPMPPALRETVVAHWRRIEGMLGTRFNYDFWTECTPRRSTWPACRAVLAAALQDCEEPMTRAIQDAYYLHAQNPSDVSTLTDLAANLGLDVERFTNDMNSAALEAELQRQIAFARRSPINGFPSLVLDVTGNLEPVTVDYHDHRTSLAELEQRLSR